MARVWTKGQNVLDVQWALRQLYFVLTQKLTGQVEELESPEEPQLGNGGRSTQQE